MMTSCHILESPCQQILYIENCACENRGLYSIDTVLYESTEYTMCT